jgi:glutathione S-transferase
LHIYDFSRKSRVARVPSENAITLYGSKLSGHAHRVELLLRMLRLPYRYVDAQAAFRSSAEFQALNPLRQIPVLIDGPLTLADSNAILVYLAVRYAPGGTWLPQEAVAAAQVQRWLSLAAGELRYGPALARRVSLWGFAADLKASQQTAVMLLDFMEQHLQGRRWLAAGHPTIADLACYSYVAHAPEGGLPLEAYGAVRAWLAAVEGLPGFEPMPTPA